VIRTTDTPGTYRLESGTARLVDLQDQLGSTLALRGIAWSLNGHWWFEYRGIDMYVENMQEMPGWCIDLHGRPIEITGLLEEATLPAIDQISLKSDRESKKYFIVRTPSWRPIDALLSPERVE